jgi:hypothetical protein
VLTGHITAATKTRRTQMRQLGDCSLLHSSVF